MENGDQLPQGNRSIAKFLSLIIIYIFLTFSAQYSQHQAHNGAAIIDKIHTPFSELKISDLTSLYELQQTYTGQWENTHSNSDQSDFPLNSDEGIFRLSLTRIISNNKHQRFLLTLSLINGKQIDQGVLSLTLILQSQNITSVRLNDNSIGLTLAENKLAQANLLFTKLFLVEEEGPTSISSFSFNFDYNLQKELSAVITLTVSDDDLKLKIMDRQPRLLKLLIFAGIIFLVSYIPFTAALNLLKHFTLGQENPLHHSLFTMTMATMWDTILCMVAFKIAFEDQESLVMFILPAFMLCLLFTNLEPRLMLIIFQKNQVPGQERRCLTFNLLSYGSLIAIYPLVIFTNFNAAFFITFSCLIFPQIYLNALRGIRPDPSSPYYLKFLLSRFLIIFYLRSFPYNVFSLQPNYTLTIFCFALLILQFSLLYLQKKYGPKIVVPSWMLEPVFDYNYEEAVNLEENGEDHECAICLVSLRKNPPDQDGDFPLRLMKTPCKHNYHSSCLIAWMKIKMECPQCRAMLPPHE